MSLVTIDAPRYTNEEAIIHEVMGMKTLVVSSSTAPDWRLENFTFLSNKTKRADPFDLSSKRCF